MTKSISPETPELAPFRGLRPAPATVTHTTTTTRSPVSGISTTTNTWAPTSSSTSTTSTTTGKGASRTTTNTTTTTSEYFYSTQSSSNTTTATSLDSSLPSVSPSTISVTEPTPTNSSTQQAVVSRTSSTSSGILGKGSSSGTTFFTQSNASGVSTTFTKSTTTDPTQTTSSTPTITTTSNSEPTKTKTTLFGDTYTSTTLPSDLSQPTTRTTSTTLASSSRTNTSTTFSLSTTQSSSPSMTVSSSSSGSVPNDSTVSKSVVMHTTTTSSSNPTSSPSTTSTIYADNGSRYLLTTTTSTSSPTGSSTTKSFIPTTTFTVGTSGTTDSTSSSAKGPTTYFLSTSSTPSVSNWEITGATATFTSSSQSKSTSTPSIQITLSPTDPATTSTKLIQSFDTTTLPQSFFNSTTNVVSVLANVTHVSNFTNLNLNAANQPPGNSSIGFISGSSQEINYYSSAASAPPWLAYAVGGAAFLGVVGAFVYGVWNRAGALQVNLNSHLTIANSGQLDEASINILRSQGRQIMNRLAYSLVNGRDVPSLRDRIEGIVAQNSLATDSMRQLVSAQTDALRAISQEVSSIRDMLSSQVQGRLEAGSNCLIATESPIPSIRVGSRGGLPATLPVTLYGQASEDIVVRRLTDLGISTVSTKDSRIVDLWSYLMKVEQLTCSNTEKYQALALAQVKVLQILNEGNIDQSDISILFEQLIPRTQLESNAINLWVANLDSTSRLAGTQNLLVTPLNSSLYSWNTNFIPGGAYRNDLELGKARIFLMDPDRPVFDNSWSRTNNLNSILLDNKNSQYIGSDANEFITISGGSNTTYNIAAMGGNDVIVVNPQMIGSSVVNIYGGLGNNTYVIFLQSSWEKLPSTVHIWDFDRSKDSIIFVSDRLGGVTPYIKENKRTLFNSTVDNWSLYPNGEIRFVKSVAQTASLSENIINLFPSYFVSNYFGAAEHEFTGEGLPLIVIDEKNYATNNPNSLFSYPNVFRSSQTVDIADNISGETAPLFVGSEPNTLFSQLDSNNDHDLFKIHLKAGKIYVFSMSHNPNVAGDAVLDTTLVLKDAQGKTLANSNLLISSKLTGNSRIDYVALQDGDYYLDASGSAPSMAADNGKYSISAVEIDRTDCWPSDPHVNGFRGGDCVTSGSFKNTTNHVGFKISLLAGDYVDLNFAALGSPTITIVDSTGASVKTWFNTSISQNNQTFMAQKTGDYFIDAKVISGSDTPFVLHTNLKDIEGDYSTKADLNVNNVVSSSINSHGDHDFFRVFLDANQTYQFDMKRGNYSPLDSYLKLFNSDQKKVACNDDVNASCLDSRIVYRPSVSGQYFLDAGAFGNGTIGDYSLSYKII